MRDVFADLTPASQEASKLRVVFICATPHVHLIPVNAPHGLFCAQKIITVINRLCSMLCSVLVGVSDSLPWHGPFCNQTTHMWRTDLSLFDTYVYLLIESRAAHKVRLARSKYLCDCNTSRHWTILGSDELFSCYFH